MRAIFLTEGEVAALTRDTGAPGSTRVVPLAFGGGKTWLRDTDGRYPRWITLRLAVLRGISIATENPTEQELVELEAFAARHSREVIV